MESVSRIINKNADGKVYDDISDYHISMDNRVMLWASLGPGTIQWGVQYHLTEALRTDKT